MAAESHNKGNKVIFDTWCVVDRPDPTWLEKGICRKVKVVRESVNITRVSHYSPFYHWNPYHLTSFDVRLFMVANGMVSVKNKW